MKQCTASELAAHVGGELKGRPDIGVRGVAGLDEARPDTVSFLGNEQYSNRVATTRAGVLMLPADWSGAPSRDQAWILCDSPSDAFSAAVEMFAPPPPDFPAGIHARAVVSPGSRIAATAHVGACAVVEAGASIGERSVVGAGSYLGQGTSVGDDCLLYPNTTLREAVTVGNRVIIHSGAVIGADGFGFIPARDGHAKIPQRGTVQIDDDVEIGAQTAVDRARFGRTWIKRGVKIDNLVHVGHNVIIGEHSFIVAQVGLSGSTTLGDRVTAAGQVGVAGHLTIGDDAILMGQAGVTRDIPANARVVGMPAADRREFARRLAAGRQVEQLRKDVKELRTRIHELESRNPCGAE